MSFRSSKQVSDGKEGGDSFSGVTEIGGVGEQCGWPGKLAGARSGKGIGEDERPANGVRLTSRTGSAAQLLTT